MRTPHRHPAAWPAAVLATLCLVTSLSLADGHGEFGPLQVRDSEQQLLRNAAGYEDRFLNRGYRYGSIELEAAVDRIGGRVAPKPADSYVRYRFHVLRDIERNAFALPDGQVYVTTGLLAVLQNEAQLAAVLAHEAQHTAGHHGILTYRTTRRKLITSYVLGPFTLGTSDIFLALSLYGYSRDLEDEADRLGAKRVVLAGYDPRQIAPMFDILAQDPEGEMPEVKTKWSTHPALRGRIETAREALPGLLVGVDPASLKVNARGYRAMVRRASLDTVQDLIGADYPRTAVDLAKKLVALDGSDAPAHVVLGDARVALGGRTLWGGESEPTNRMKWNNLTARQRFTRSEREKRLLDTPEGRDNQKRNLAEARQSYRRALQLDAGAAEAHRGLGDVYETLGRPMDAGREYVAYLKARPDAADRPLILERLRTINASLKKGGQTR